MEGPLVDLIDLTITIDNELNKTGKGANKKKGIDHGVCGHHQKETAQWDTAILAWVLFLMDVVCNPWDIFVERKFFDLKFGLWMLTFACAASLIVDESMALVCAEKMGWWVVLGFVCKVGGGIMGTLWSGFNTWHDFQKDRREKGLAAARKTLEKMFPPGHINNYNDSDKNHHDDSLPPPSPLFSPQHHPSPTSPATPRSAPPRRSENLTPTRATATASGVQPDDGSLGVDRESRFRRSDRSDRWTRLSACLPASPPPPP